MKHHLTSSSGGQLPHFDYITFTNYEAQVSALMEGHIDVAWNGPVAHVMAQDVADGNNVSIASVGMRDVDRDFECVALIRREDHSDEKDVSASKALKGSTIATGSTDSPQGHLVPVDWLLHTVGVDDAEIVPHEYDLGKHGDTAAGEIRALEALLGRSDGTSAALLSRMMYQRGLEGKLNGIHKEELQESVMELCEAPPLFDHCTFDVVMDHSSDQVESHRDKIQAFSKAILSMDMKDPCQAPIMKMEGIRKQWMGPRDDPGMAVRMALHRRGLANAPEVYSQKRAFSSSLHSSTGERVAVLGAGVSGLQSVRALRAKGFNVTAFDPNPKVGGLWRENYLSYGVQVPKQLYEFPDLEFSEVEFGKYPTGAEVQKYIERKASISLHIICLLLVTCG